MSLPVSLIVVLTILQIEYSLIYSCSHNTSCGCSNKIPLYARIAGGHNAGHQKWNWIVAIRIRSRFLCAGSILSNLWILTAAHCFFNTGGSGSEFFQVNTSDITIHAGSINKNKENQLRNVVQIFFHPKYDSSTFLNDIALLKLSAPLPINNTNLNNICLPNISLDEYPPVDSLAVAIGWGKLWQDGPEPSILQQVILNVIDYENASCYSLITDQSKQFCAGVGDGKKDTCQGDSGGPLMIFTKSHQWVIVGITSYGYGCAKVGYSGVYTRIVAYLDWISLYVNITNDSYPYSLLSSTPFDDDSINWQNNLSYRLSSPVFLVLILLHSTSIGFSQN